MLLTWLALIAGGWLVMNWVGKSNQSLWQDLTSTRDSVRQLSESVKAGNPALSGEVGRLREDAQSVLTRLESLERGLASGLPLTANDGPSRQAVEGAKLAGLAAKTAALRERLQKLKSLQATWQAKSGSLLTGDLGRRIAASSSHLELVIGMLEQDRPSAEQIRQWDSELLPLATPVEQAAKDKQSYLAVTPQHEELLAALDRQVTQAVQSFESQQLLLEAIERETANLAARGETLEKLLKDRRLASEKANAERLLAVREAARQEAEQSVQQRVAQLEREVVEAKGQREEQKLLADKARAQQLAKADQEQMAEETRVTDALHRATVAGLKEQAKRVDEELRFAQLARELERDMPAVQGYLSAFIRDGFKLRADGVKGPASLSFIEGQGALEPTRSGYQKLSSLASDSDRPSGALPNYIAVFVNGAVSTASIEKAQQLLIKYGKVMEKKGLLAP